MNEPIATVTAPRVNARGEMTGEADLSVWRQGSAVYVKLARQRVHLSLAQWAQLAAAAETAAGEQETST